MKKSLILFAVWGVVAALLWKVVTPTGAVTVVSPTPTLMPTLTLIPTLTPTLTPTPTPTPTPIILPVTNGTPIPALPYEVITAKNITRLQQVARYGYPRLLDTNPYRLTADGKTLVVGTTLGLEFYDAQTQEKQGGFEVEFLESFDMTPDGQRFLTSAGGTLTVWTRDGQKVRSFDGLEIGDVWELNPVALSPDGTLLAVQRKKTDWQEADKVDVYRVADGSLVDTVRGNGVIFSAQYLATVFDGSVRLYPVAELGQGWETRLPKQSLSWCRASEGVSCGLAFSPDGALAAVVRPARVDVYQVGDRRLVRQVSGWETDTALPQVQFAGGQMLIVSSPIYGPGGMKVKPLAIAVDIASGEWLSKSEVENGFAYLEGEQVRVFPWAEMNTARLLGIKNDGQLVLESEKCQVVDSNLTCYWLSKDGKDWRLMSEQGETVLQFKSQGENRLGVWVFPGYIVVSHVFGVGAYEKGFSHIYDSAGQRVARLNGVVASSSVKTGEVAVILLTENYFDSKLQGIILRPGERPKSFAARAPDVSIAGVSSDGLVTLGHTTRSSGSVLSIRDVNNSALLAEWSIPVECYYWFWERFSPDFRLFVCRAKRGIGIIDLSLGVPTGTYIMSELAAIADAQFSPDGRLFATYSTDGFIRVWAVAKNP